ncbi:MAG: 6-carboxytetrahydropterin synthase QueD [Thermoprotei archaeon]
MVELWRIAVETEFSAAHIIPGHPKCGRMHGHNYKVEVVVVGDKVDQNGFLIDFGVLKSSLNAVVGALDHTYLNDTIPKGYQPPSAENIAAHIHASLRVPPSFGVTVRVWETPHQWAEYTDKHT